MKLKLKNTYCKKTIVFRNTYLMFGFEFTTQYPYNKLKYSSYTVLKLFGSQSLAAGIVIIIADLSKQEWWKSFCNFEEIMWYYCKPLIWTKLYLTKQTLVGLLRVTVSNLKILIFKIFSKKELNLLLRVNFVK